MAWKTHTKNNKVEFRFKTSEFEISKGSKSKLLLANEFLKVGYQALDKFENYVKLNPLKDSADDPEKMRELTRIIPGAIVGCFNLSHGFELLLKCLMKEAGIAAKGSHQLKEHMDSMLERVPEIESNLRGIEGHFKLASPLKISQLFENIKNNYHNTRYAYEKKKPVTFINMQHVLLIIIAITSSFKRCPPELTEYWRVPK